MFMFHSCRLRPPECGSVAGTTAGRPWYLPSPMSAEPITIEPIAKTDDDYAVVVAIHNATHPRFAVTENEYKRDDIHHHDAGHRRWLARRAGQPVGYAGLGKMKWSDRPGKLYMELIVPESETDDVREALYQVVLGEAREAGAVTLAAFSEGDHPVDDAFKRSKGFVQTHQDEDSELEVATVDWERWEPCIAAVEAQGLEVVTLVEYRKRCPEATERMYALYAESFLDVPSPEPLTPDTFENYSKYVGRPDYPAHFVAVVLDGLIPVGMLTQRPREMDATVVDVGLAGVLRAYRCRGVARALKVKSLQLLRDAGVTMVRTGNNVNNPMFRLNQAIGFKQMPPWIHLSLDLGSGA